MSSQVQLYLGDCLEVMKTLPDGYVDAVVTDPPYGIDWIPRVHNRMAIIGDNGPFNPMPLLQLGKFHILWGANNYASRLPDSRCWLMWLKHDQGLWDKRSYSPFDLAWTDIEGTSKAFRYIWDGYIKQGEEHNTIQLHPAQKPIALMAWCIEMCTSNGDTVLDPFMGSGTTGVACVRTGRNFIGIEIDPGYFKIAERRIAEAQQQLSLLEA